MNHYRSLNFHVIIEEDEWRAFPKEKREKVKYLLLEYGYDISAIDKALEGDEDERD